MPSPRLKRSAALLMVMLLPAFASAQGKKDKNQKKQEEGVRAQLQVLAPMVDAAMTAPAADSGVKWRSDFSMKGQDDKTYLPFTLTVDSSKLTAGTAVLYLRVAQKGQPAPAGNQQDKQDKQEKRDDSKAPEQRIYPFENFNAVQLKGAGPGQPYSVSRAILVPGGEYDLYAVVAEQTGEPSKNKPALGRSVLLKHSISVPDYAGAELTMTPVLIAEKIDQLSAPLSPDQQAERPYTIGALDITPLAEPKLSKKTELSFLFVVYGIQTNEAGKPDLQIEHNFYQKTAGGEKFFNKTQPQQINASTMPADANIGAMRQVTGGQTIPLTSFPEGDYRLEIKVNDKLANKSLTRDVLFTVAP